ncbi:MAG: alpha/beta fold hydrolase [Hyphomonadaceae bacterium]
MGIVRTIVLCVAVLGVGLAAPFAAAKPPAEAFGEPTVRHATMSPDGKKIASIWWAKDGQILVITDIETGKSKAIANVTAVKPESLDFVTPDYVIGVVSQTERYWGEKYQTATAYSFEVNSGKFVQLDGVRVLGVAEDAKSVYMWQWTTRGNAQTTAVFQVDLATGKSVRTKNGWGSNATIDFIISPTGEPQLREEYFESSGKHDILRMDGQNWSSFLSERTGDLSLTLEGVRVGDRATLISSYDENDVLSLFTLDTTSGEMTQVLSRQDTDAENLLLDSNRVIHGVRYSGMVPTYSMFDPAIDSAVRKVQNALSGTSTFLISWSKDWSKMLFYSEGGASSGEYFIFTRATGSLQSLLGVRPGIPDDAVAEVEQFEYAARDHLKIPALVTWPIGVAAADRKNLPLIVMPHGGPASYDMVGYDGMAQFFANEGYAVLQPNFRGSSGFGLDFELAGENEWGRKMQNDISDGLAALVDQGSVNPKRVCIVGWSYGGYAALAGGALTPDLYSCVVAVAGVSGLREMLDWEYDRHGGKSRSYRYWTSVIGDPSKSAAAIDAVSPTRLASKFKAPVLLIHGNDDTTVPASQSSMMADALKDAGKDVTFKLILGDDHDLGEGVNRKTVFETMATFVKAHMPAE